MKRRDEPRPGNYQIRLRGHLGSEWSSWFDGMSVTLEESGDTVLSGPVPDQAALHGLLKKIRDAGVPLISVLRIDGAERRNG